MGVVFGTGGDDSLNGSNNSDLIVSGRGDDTIAAGAGHDLVFAGSGNDVVDGGDGWDLIFGGRGDDEIDGGAGNDLLVGGKGDDTLIGGAGNDKLIGGRGNDLFVFLAGFGTDRIIDFRAGAGSPDRILFRDTEVADFTDVLSLASNVGSSVHINFSNGDKLILKNLSIADLHADDFLFETTSAGLFSNNDDTVDFNAVTAGDYVDGTQYDALDGNDVVTLAADATAAANAGYVVGTAFNAGLGNDEVIGGSLDDEINGGDGDDTLSGGSGDDTLNGGAGNDRLILGDISAGDQADGGDDTDVLEHVFASGSDHVAQAGVGSVDFDGTIVSVLNVENFAFTGADGDDTLIGAAGDDTLIGGDGADRLIGRQGADVLNGGDGNDSVDINDLNGDQGDGGTGIDTMQFSFNQAVDFDLGTGVATLVGGGGSGSFVNFENASIFGGGGSLIGTNDVNLFSALGGNNFVSGLGANDVVFVDEGGDTVDGGAGDRDQLRFVNPGLANLEVDLVNNTTNADGVAGQTFNNEWISTFGLNSDDTIIGSAVSEFADLGNGNDVIDMGGGDDGISVTDGGDDIDGGAGFDVLNLSAITDDINADVAAGTFQVGAGPVTSLANVERILGGIGNDSLRSGNDASVLEGGDGNDQLVGGAGGDTLLGGDGNDTFFTRSGSDRVEGGDGSDFVSIDDLDGDTGDGGDDFDTIQFNFSQGVNFDLATGVASLVGGGGNGVFTNFEGASIFGPGGATVSGTNESNNLFVRGTGNTISLLDGADNIDMDAGGNDVDGGLGIDSMRFNLSDDVMVDLDAGTTSVNGVAGTVVGIEIVRTGAGDDRITGSANGDRIEVLTGNDTVNAGDGDDVIFISDGGDMIDGGDDLNDTLFISTTSDTTINLDLGTVDIVGDALGQTTITDIENIQSGSGADNIIGSAGRDNLAGNAGNDTLTSGDVTAGLTDALSGGDGDDHLIINGPSVQAGGGTGTDIFEFIDYSGAGSGPQFAQLFDVNPGEGDRIDLTDWGVTEADILAGYNDLGADSQVTIGNLSILIRGIDNTEFDTAFFDFV